MINKLNFKATIATGQYQNIQPEIELCGVNLEEGTELGMNFIKDCFKKYGEKGELKENLSIIATGEKKSFNEDITINFDPISHVYMYGDKKLVSATEYIKKFYKEFDEETMSSVSAKSWGVEQQDVKDLWKANGELTSSLGSVIHKALENYDKFSSVGDKISSKKEMDSNYAMPKHPILKSAIEGFIKINKTKGKVIPEALITDVNNGFCGHADRILIVDEKKKVCRIQDYKINIGAEEVSSSLKVGGEFKDLPATKLSKYQLQLSFYANMLQKSGWTVEGLDIFVLEDEWKYYKLDVLKVI